MLRTKLTYVLWSISSESLHERPQLWPFAFHWLVFQPVSLKFAITLFQFCLLYFAANAKRHSLCLSVRRGMLFGTVQRYCKLWSSLSTVRLLTLRSGWCLFNIFASLVEVEYLLLVTSWPRWRRWLGESFRGLPERGLRSKDFPFLCFFLYNYIL